MSSSFEYTPEVRALSFRKRYERMNDYLKSEVQTTECKCCVLIGNRSQDCFIGSGF